MTEPFDMRRFLDEMPVEGLKWGDIRSLIEQNRASAHREGWDAALAAVRNDAIWVNPLYGNECVSAVMGLREMIVDVLDRLASEGPR